MRMPCSPDSLVVHRLLVLPRGRGDAPAAVAVAHHRQADAAVHLLDGGHHLVAQVGDPVVEGLRVAPHGGAAGVHATTPLRIGGDARAASPRGSLSSPRHAVGTTAAPYRRTTSFRPSATACVSRRLPLSHSRTSCSRSAVSSMPCAASASRSALEPVGVRHELAVDHRLDAAVALAHVGEQLPAGGADEQRDEVGTAVVQGGARRACRVPISRSSAPTVPGSASTENSSSGSSLEPPSGGALDEGLVQRADVVQPALHRRPGRPGRAGRAGPRR